MSSAAAGTSAVPSGGIAKVLVVGNVATGKTSVINRFARNKFSKEYQTTIGVDFALKRVKAGGAELNVQLWDIAGQESDTFDAVLKWKHDIDNKVFLPSGERIPVLLLGNKSDLLDEGHTPCIPTADLDNFLAHNSFYAHYLCSAKTGHNVKEACTHLVARIHHNNQAQMTAPGDADAGSASAGGSSSVGGGPSSSNTIKLSEVENQPEPKAGCC